VLISLKHGKTLFKLFNNVAEVYVTKVKESKAFGNDLLDIGLEKTVSFPLKMNPSDSKV
jgi:hypothetical protein